MTFSRVSLLLAATMSSAFAAEPLRAPVASQTTAVPQASAPIASSMGRLFFTPEERAMIDDSRKRPVAAAAAPAPQALPPAPEYVMLNGVVRRSDGSTSVWLNNRMLDGRRTSEGLEVTDSKRGPGAASVTVKVPQAGRSVDLRVGQQLDTTSGKVQERYQLAPRAPASPSSSELTTPEPANTAQRSVPSRRPSRERELRDLVRDIEDSQAERLEPPRDTKG